MMIKLNLTEENISIEMATCETVIDGKEFILLLSLTELTDELYDKMKPLIEEMGGHWRKKYQGFLFSKEPLRMEYSEKRESEQFYPTPDFIAKRVVALAGLMDYDADEIPVILEPSAGTGSLLDQIPCDLNYLEYVVEPMMENIEILMSNNHVVEAKTFERFYKEYKNEEKRITHVIMNPPFSNGRDMKHVKMAYDLLKPGGTLVSVFPENRLYYKDNESVKFQKWLKENNAYIEDVPYGSFQEVGTMVDTVLIKIVKERDKK